MIYNLCHFGMDSTETTFSLAIFYYSLFTFQCFNTYGTPFAISTLEDYEKHSRFQHNDNIAGKFLFLCEMN